MNTPETNSTSAQKPHHGKTRRGNALLLTMLVTTGAISLISLASDRALADSSVSRLEFDRQRAGFVAETIASLIEAKLASRAAERPQDMSRNLEDDPSLWWNLEGLSYTDVDDRYIKAERALWMNGCAVRWRLEPVKIMSRSLDNDGQVSGADFTVNTETDPILAARRSALAEEGKGNNTPMTQDPGFYHFRIVAEAFALKSPRESGIAPWKQSGSYTCTMQAQRIVQIQLINLFRYVIFYAAPGETGDIEFHPGPDLAIRGSVHSNGAIYLGGGGRSYDADDYHTAATNGGEIRIGPDVDGHPVGVTGVDGIFRMRKAGNVFFAAKYDGALVEALRVTNPSMVPFPTKKTVSGKEMSGTLDLNGDSYNGRIKLNDIDFGSDNDSRSAFKDRADPSTHVLDPLVTDQVNRQARRIDTLANIPQLGGYPFEAQQIVDVGTRLYVRTSDSAFTIQNGLFVSSAAFITAGGAVTTTAGSGTLPLYATDMPLYDIQDPTTLRWRRDVWPNQPTASTSSALSPAATWPAVSGAVNGVADPVAATFTYLPTLPTATATSRPAIGYYCQQSLFGQSPLLRTTGLTIRERGAQNTAFTWLLLDGTTKAPVPISKPLVTEIGTTYVDQGEFGRAYVAWLKSNYVVYLGRNADNSPHDVTGKFFEFNLAAATAAGSFNDLVASEEEFVNRRESAWLQRKGYFPDAATAAAYRTNVLTLHVDQIQRFLSTMVWSDLDAAAPANSELANTRFNGLLYIHRTPRLCVIPGLAGWNHALMPLGYHPIADRARVPPAAIWPASVAGARYPELGLVGTFSGAVQVGEPKSFTMYPSNKAVRIARGSAINWGGVQESGRAQGLTIATPNQCYLQGDYNITADGSGKTPPCGIYADGVTVLSNAWTDTGMVYDNAVDLPKAAAATTYITSFVINNAPTDTENVFDEGSGGVHNAVRYLEDWKDCQYNFTGSLVVMNRMRYSRGNLGANNGPYYSPPNRNFTFNSDLLTKEGQPPFSPWGTSVTRVVSMLNVLNN